ncbi:MAG: 4Fe-4S dicluster domain-containing protein [Bacteroidales bacterium]|nr:4Fe-4S dicluster domain-containing protein [Tenuifilaceae bacterium]
MKRDIITIDRDKCNGCGICITGCHEGALQLIDGKAVLVSDLMCDGLGACIGDCPEGAISIEHREAVAYDEVLTISKMVANGKNTVIAHLKHLKDYNEKEFLRQGIEWLLANKSEYDFNLEEVLNAVNTHEKEESCGCGDNEPKAHHHHSGGGCPGSAAQSFGSAAKSTSTNGNGQISGKSELTHWPVQLHLINPNSGHFKGSNLLLAADCVAFSMGNFHSDYLRGKTLAIACPKLDSNKEVYVEKITALIDSAQIDTITVMRMEVPCCGGLLQIAQMAMDRAQRKVPIKLVTISNQGAVLETNWV